MENEVSHKELFTNEEITTNDTVEETTEYTTENIIDVTTQDTTENTIENILSNTTIEETTENTVEDTNVVTLETIHNDLGFICSFLIIGAVLIFMRILYKLFNMFF